MIARQHHYVPQCYLRGFTADRKKPKLFVVDMKDQRTFRTTPANVAEERDFHRIDVEGQAPDALENAFSHFESELSSALSRIIGNQSIGDANDRAYLFNLVASLATKNPRLREVMRDARARTAKMIMNFMTSTPTRWQREIQRAKDDGFLDADAETDYEKMRDFVRRNDYQIEVPPSGHLPIEMRMFDSVLPFIFQRKWMLFKAPKNTTGFITSDHPVCLMWSDPARRGRGLPPGLGLKGTQILFPISSQLAMVGAFELDEDEVSANELTVSQINGSTILHATRQIYAMDGHFPYRMQHHARTMRGVDLVADLRSRR